MAKGHKEDVAKEAKEAEEVMEEVQEEVELQLVGVTMMKTGVRGVGVTLMVTKTVSIRIGSVMPAIRKATSVDTANLSARTAARRLAKEVVMGPIRRTLF